MTQTQVKKCHFCLNQISDVDYKDITTLQNFTNSYGQILPRRRTGVCSKHQRKLANAVKRARMMALLLFTNR
ncbi:MAG: 30S ribosomal protein S18 [Candidatus Falkowbacteria bacterium GW2011_GWA2_39_24]|uniref:Small ribosomal subunit protein bS18 n=1 Tax=Candidatus Falkowbacteria bacterium GW2011_GWA2_39_24 TaxID=1618634 RepID=A0A0G0NHN4_9BACT|nr:MAG: 30S ribosomal protein S18 [Candidatus Falkowbacteria bacterium GW2011_GWA2_39_24]